MRKRIFGYMAVLTVTSTVVLCLVTFLFFVIQTPMKTTEELRGTRVTIIAEDGTVIYDSDSNTQENHADRPEIQDALSYGVGESVRYSDTLNEATHYYALRMPDNTVARIARTESSSDDWLLFVLPLLIIGAIFSLLVSLAAANFLTKRLVAPLINVDLDNPDTVPFDELAPFMSRLSAEKKAVLLYANELKERDDTITALTADMQEGLLIMDEVCNILSANTYALNIFGITEYEGRNLIEITRDMEIITAAREAVAGNKKEVRIMSGKKAYDIMMSPARYGEKCGAIAFFVDVTEKIASQRQRHEFTANVSHELKTPLTTISGLAELMRVGSVDAKDIPEFSGKIYDQSARLSRLIEDIIRLSELDEGALQAHFEKLDFSALAKQIVKRFEETTADPVNIEITTETCIIDGNEVMLSELLENLLTNAVKYGKADGKVVVSVKKDGDEAVLSVTDDGIGIATEHKERIFERFYRVDKSRSKRTGGTGLGLAIVKHVAELHGGTVGVDSTPGEYSTFYCRFPIV